jgi:putative FmdB family regulatory protein
MPMYQYACNDCGHDFEKKLRMSQSGEAQACPSCGSMETRKRIGAFAVGGSTTTGAVTNRAPARSPFS